MGHQPTAGKAKYTTAPMVQHGVVDQELSGMVVCMVGESRSGIEAWETLPTGDNGSWQQNTEIKTHATI